jgi:hypothetical protein
VAIIPTRSSLARITQKGFHRHHRQCRERERDNKSIFNQETEGKTCPHVKNANQILNLNTTVPLNSPCFDVTWNDVISDNSFDFAPFQFSLKIRLPFFYLIWMDVRFLCCIFNFHCHFLNIVFHLLKFRRRFFSSEILIFVHSKSPNIFLEWSQDFSGSISFRRFKTVWIGFSVVLEADYYRFGSWRDRH